MPATYPFTSIEAYRQFEHMGEADIEQITKDQALQAIAYYLYREKEFGTWKHDVVKHDGEWSIKFWSSKHDALEVISFPSE